MTTARCFLTMRDLEERASNYRVLHAVRLSERWRANVFYKPSSELSAEAEMIVLLALEAEITQSHATATQATPLLDTIVNAARTA